MAEAKKAKRTLKKTQTVRERANKPVTDTKKKRFTKARSVVVKPLKKAAAVGRKEYYLPMPDNKVGRFLNKRRSAIPSYFKESWAEVKQVTWPGRRQTLQLSLAVFMFALFFSLLIAVVDFGLDKLFKALILS